MINSGKGKEERDIINICTSLKIFSDVGHALSGKYIIYGSLISRLMFSQIKTL